MNLKSLSIGVLMLSCTTVTVMGASKHTTDPSQNIDKPLSRSDTVRVYLGKDGLQHYTKEEADAAKPHGKPSLVDEDEEGDEKKDSSSTPALSTITPPAKK